MTLRNVPKAHTLEQQRQEINLIASDLDTAVDGTKTFGGSKTFSSDVTFSSTVDFNGIATFNSSPTFSDNVAANFGDDADLKIYYDGSVGVLTSFIDSDALQIRSESDTSELYATFLKDGPVELYYDGTKRFGTSSTGASVIGDLTVSANLEVGQLTSSTGEIVIEDDLKFDAAGAHIEFTPSAWSGSAPYMEFWVGNNGGSQYAQIDGGNAGQLQIMNTGHPNGHLDLRTAKDFSVDCGGYYAILAQATGATKIWHPVSQENILNPKFETTATGAKVNGFFESSLLVNTNNTPTAGEGIEMFYDSAASGGAAGSIQAYDRDGAALTRLKIKSSNWEILNDGSGTFGGDISVQDSSYLRVRSTGDNASTAVQLGPDGTGSFASGALQIASTGNLSVNRTTGTNDVFNGKLNGTVTSTINADGTASFAGNTTVGAPDVSNASVGGVELFASGQLRIQRDSAGSASDKRFQMYYGTTETASITADGSATFAGDINTDGALTFPSQPNSSVGNNVVETSSSFSHYEQGTFTPYYGFGLTSPTYSFNAGDYIRIGNVVHYYITISATGTNNTDSIEILGLPYNPAGTEGGSSSFAYSTGLVSNGATMPNIYLDPNGRIRFYEPGSGSALAGNSGNGLSGAQLYFGGHYICA